MLGAVECKIDGSGIGFRSDDEIELRFALLAVIGQVDTGINILIRDASVLRNIGVPVFRIVAAIVVAFAWQLVSRCKLPVGVPPHKPHTNHRVPLSGGNTLGLQGWDAAARGQAGEKARSATARRQ